MSSFSVAYYKLGPRLFLLMARPVPTRDGLFSGAMEADRSHIQRAFHTAASTPGFASTPTPQTALKDPCSLPGTSGVEPCPQLPHGCRARWHKPSPAPKPGAPQEMEQAQGHPWESMGRAMRHLLSPVGFTHLPRKFKVTVIFWKV